jgi:hypothetical protein
MDIFAPSKIDALNWRWGFQFGHCWFRFGSAAFVCLLPAPVGQTHRSAL